MLAAIRRLPEYVRLLGRLMRDRRVSRMDRALVVATLVYVFAPLDFVPDVIPFLGQVDDVFLLVVSITRLFENAGRAVLLSHWRHDPGELDPRWLRKVALAAAPFMPRSTRRRLRRFASSALG
jgi:uncharacterized membrane protein YkvA (DUF1232 family)